MADDSSAVTAEYAEIFRASRPEKDLATQVGAVLAGLHPDAEPVVDLGAGTGVGTIGLAGVLPESNVFAVERSRAMRSILLARLALRPDLHERVTVIPHDVFEAELPDRWGAAIAVHLVCQLEPTERRRLWALLATRLDESGVAVIDQHFGLGSTATVAQRLSAEVRIGENTYQRWFESEPIDPCEGAHSKHLPSRAQWPGRRRVGVRKRPLGRADTGGARGNC